MKQLYFLFILFSSLFITNLSAQNAGCDGERYIDDVFTDFKVTPDVVYGEAITLNGSSKTLKMDIYEPLDDSLEERPVVILAHGGSFIGGDKSEFAPICEAMARKGYVAATISYRLINALVLDSTQISEIVVMATLDMKAAVRFFREDAVNDDQYKVDPSLILIGGASAGGILSSHAALMDSTDVIPNYILDHIEDNGGFEGNSSDNQYYSSDVQGLLNYSGSLGRANFIDVNDIPFYSAHDEFDPVVPCGYAATNVVPFPVFTYGSCSMKARADEIGLENHLYLVEGSSGHVSFFVDGDTAVAQEVLDESLDYMLDIVCGPTNQQPHINQDLATTEQSQSVSVAVNSNDSDDDGSLNLNSLRILSGPSNGNATTQIDGSIVYQPESEFHGVDSFEYLLCDDGVPTLCNKATVTVTVNEATVSSNNNNTSYQAIVSVYPNPVINELKVLVSNFNEVYHINIYSLTGKLVYEQKNIEQQSLKINKLPLMSGTYVMRITSESKNTIYLRKLIVM